MERQKVLIRKKYENDVNARIHKKLCCFGLKLVLMKVFSKPHLSDKTAIVLMEFSLYKQLFYYFWCTGKNIIIFYYSHLFLN